MYHIIKTIFFLFFISTLLCEAQSDAKVRRKDFKAGKAGFKTAWEHVVAGDAYYIRRGLWYSNAFDEYLQAIVYNNSNPELNYKTGVSAIYTDHKEEAAGFFLKALEAKPDVADDILLFAGRALQYAGRYDEAIDKFTAYLSSNVRKSEINILLANRCTEECNSAAIVTKDTLRIEILNAGSNINSASDEYSPVFSFDGKTMYLASRRKLDNSVSNYFDFKFDENILVSNLSGGGWEAASSAGQNLKTKYCETPLYIDSAGEKLYIYSGYENGGDIKVSSLNKKGEWRTPESVPFRINSNGMETSFTINPSGEEIFFVTSDGKDNIGGKDVFYIKKISDKKWSKPENPGPEINTKYDEESVDFSQSGDTLWFSSRGHNSIGGFDIFFSVRQSDGTWSSAINFGYPLNTVWDELFYKSVPSSDSIFYFASNRNGGLGGLDIYTGRLLPPEPVQVELPQDPPQPDTIIIRDTVVVEKQASPPLVPAIVIPVVVKEPEFYLAGRINDSETGNPMIAKIDVIDIGSDLIVATTISSETDGSYRITIPEKKSYKVDLNSPGYLSEVKRIDIPSNWPTDVYNFNIDLIKVVVGKKVVLNNILFESGKAVLTSGSYTELDRLLNMMNENQLMKIEVSGHTDKTGSEPINFKLSENRAKTVVDYLFQKGISQSRMEYKGFGSLQPLSENITYQGRAKNRRVEFKILEF